MILSSSCVACPLPRTLGRGHYTLGRGHLKLLNCIVFTYIFQSTFCCRNCIYHGFLLWIYSVHTTSIAHPSREKIPFSVALAEFSSFIYFLLKAEWAQFAGCTLFTWRSNLAPSLQIAASSWKRDHDGIWSAFCTPSALLLAGVNIPTEQRLTPRNIPNIAK